MNTTVQTADAYDVDSLATFLERQGVDCGPAFVIAGYMLTGHNFLKPLADAMRAAFPGVSAKKVFAVANAARAERDALLQDAADRKARCSAPTSSGYSLPGEVLTWKGYAGSAFASDLGLGAGQAMSSFVVVGKAQSIEFQLARTDHDAEGDVMGWHYIAPGEAYEVTIHND